jgi:uncharacterized protein YbjT (DUF2867 family)
MSRAVFVTGGTGYMGRRLIPVLLKRGHTVRAIARGSSVSRVPTGATALVGDALDADAVAAMLSPHDTVVHLIGTPHPNPSKAQQFIDVDLASARAIATAAKRAGVQHLVYVSVAHPAPVMRDYIAARVAGEAAVRESGIAATVLRPWYVLGPGHWWPLVLVPLYALGSAVPSLRDGARRLGLVTLNDMVRALAGAVDSPPASGTVRVVDVPGIRSA